jgi:hypothetical protein
MRRVGLLLTVFALAACSSGKPAAVVFRAAQSWRVGSQPTYGWAARGIRPTKTYLPGMTSRFTLRPQGIAISLNLGRPSKVTYDYGMAWPPRVTARHVNLGLEGLPARMSNFQWYGNVGHHGAALIVIFGRPTPTAHELALANAELRSAKLP